VDLKACEERFKLISSAYSALTDERERRIHDVDLRRHLATSGHKHHRY
jgi:curved DNA-binding protein CbpA